MTDEKKLGEIKNLIDALCKQEFIKDPNEINKWIERLVEVCSNGYRHSYSDIFFQVQNIILSSKEPEVLDVLGENLNSLENQIVKMISCNPSNEELKKMNESYKKLSDHIKLKIGRYNFIRTQFSSEHFSTGSSSSDNNENAKISKLANDMEQLSNDFNQIRPIATDTKKQLDSLDAKLEKDRISSITTLTIFSAVVLAFSGGITFESGILQGMTGIAPYRLVFIAALSGFILFNTIFALLYIVGKMSQRQIGTRCKYMGMISLPNTNQDRSSCTCGDGLCTKNYSTASVACRIFHKYTYVLVINTILLYVMYADFFLWLGQGQFQSIQFLSSQAIFAFAICAIAIYYMLRKNVQYKRAKLSLKIDMIQDIVCPPLRRGMIILPYRRS